MQQSSLSDVARQFAVIFTAIFQVYAAYTIGPVTGAIAQEFRSVILPATYAFGIWGPIYILCGIYAIYQALPAQRENPIFRAIGWWSAGAFLANGVWLYVYANRQFVLSQVIILAGLIFAGMAYFRFVQHVPAARATSLETLLVGPALGLLFGWLTAANIVGLANTLVSQGLSAAGQGAEIGGAGLLLLGGAVAFFVILFSRGSTPGAWVAYSGAVIWALVAVVVEHRADSLLTVGAAVVGIILVLTAMFGPWGTTRPLLRAAAS